LITWLKGLQDGETTREERFARRTSLAESVSFGRHQKEEFAKKYDALLLVIAAGTVRLPQ
jgi:hypothetical protein